jgi:hypothetical protein
MKWTKWSWEFIKSIEAITYNVRATCVLMALIFIFGSLFKININSCCFYLIMGCIVLCIIDIIRNWMIVITINKEIDNIHKEALELLNEINGTRKKTMTKKYNNDLTIAEKIDRLIAKSRKIGSPKDREFFWSDFKVVWEYIGEGMSGDYNQEDEDDYPHLRFSCYKRPEGHVKGIFEWEQMDDASYCTCLPTSTPKTILKLASDKIMLSLHEDYKKRLEELSWLSLDTFRKELEK